MNKIQQFHTTKSHTMSDKSNNKKKEFINAMYKTKCNVSESCSIAGISRQTFYNWTNKDPEFAEAVEEANEANVDFVESSLLQRINEGDTTAIIFYLKTKGKKRGYVETQEIVGNKETPVRISFSEALNGIDTSITDDELKP